MSDFSVFEQMPKSLTAGDAVGLSLTELSALYPPASYQVIITMRLKAGSPVSVTLTDVSGVHAGTLTLPGTAAQGAWNYSIRVTEIAGQALSRIVENGVVYVTADAASGDARSHAEKTLDAIEAVIENRASKDQQSYSIAGRALTRMSIAELLDFRLSYRAEVAKERARGKPNGGRRVSYARFNQVVI